MQTHSHLIFIGDTLTNGLTARYILKSRLASRYPATPYLISFNKRKREMVKMFSNKRILFTRNYYREPFRLVIDLETSKTIGGPGFALVTPWFIFATGFYFNIYK